MLEFLNLFVTSSPSESTLLNLIGDILDISKVEAGKLAIRNTHFDLQECVEDVIMLLAPGAIDKGLSLTSLHYTDTPTDIYAPRERISQILINVNLRKN